MNRFALLGGFAAVAVMVSCEGGGDRNGVDAAAAPRFVALPTTDHLDGLAREPMIVQRPDGAVFVSGYGEGKPLLWRSTDVGDTWVRVDVGSETDGAIGNSDVDLAVAPDGTLYFVVMSFDRTVFEGTGISIGSSRDGGSSWTWTALSRDRFDDRPWVEVAPDGTAHVIWNDGAGVSHAVSADRGLTWTERPRVHSMGGSSHLAISPTGTIAVRITPLSASSNRFDPGTDYLAVSSDGGRSWVTRELPGTREWSAYDENQDFFRWVEPIAWDSTGALYSFWSEGNSLWLARSADDGASWKRWLVVEDSAPLYFPYLIARGNGELAATWYAGLRDSIRASVAHMVVDETVEQTPHVTRADPFVFPAFLWSDTSATPVRDTAGEYIPIIFLQDGRVAIVSTIQDRRREHFGFTFRPYRIEDD